MLSPSILYIDHLVYSNSTNLVVAPALQTLSTIYPNFKKKALEFHHVCGSKVWNTDKLPK